MVVNVLKVEDPRRVEYRRVPSQEDVHGVPFGRRDPSQQREVLLERQQPLEVNLVVVLEDLVLDLLGSLPEVV